MVLERKVGKQVGKPGDHGVLKYQQTLTA
jgi:hypothetical protein